MGSQEAEYRHDVLFVVPCGRHIISSENPFCAFGGCK